MPPQGKPLGRIWAVSGQAFLVLLTLVMIFSAFNTGWQVVRTEVKVQALQGKVIVLDPGHGGPDGGARGWRGLEKEINLAVALAAAKMLEDNGARVLLTRSDDRDLSGLPPGEGPRKLRDLEARVALVNQADADALVSIHANKTQGSWSGAQVFYQPDGPRPEQSRQLAKLIQAELRRLTPTRRQAIPIDQKLLRESRMPAVTVEVGFLSNAEEEGRLLNPAYHRVLAEAISVGLAEFFSGS